MSNLLKNIVDSYSEEELKALCFELQLVYDSLPGSGTAAKALELVYYFVQQQAVPRLLTKLRADRPHIQWDFDDAEADQITAEIQRRERPNVHIQTIVASPDATVVVGSHNATTINKGLGKAGLFAVIGILGVLVIGSASVVVRTLTPSPTSIPLPTATAFSLPTPVPLSTRPTRMEGEFRIAIAQFGQIEPNGWVTASEQGSLLSGWFYDRLNAISTTTDIHPQIWHDKLNPGTTIGLIEGDTDERRAQAAAERAQQINANLIIYGYLDTNHPAGQVGFAPDFLVTGPWDDRDIVGRYRLGMPITATRVISGDNDILRLLNDRLTPRANAVALLADGLFYEMNGEPVKAVTYYSQATQLRDWDNQAGKEIAWHFLGRAYAAAHQEPEAIQAFTTALAINPDFARPYIGLGNIYYRRAQLLTPLTRRLETDDVERATDYYSQALAHTVDADALTAASRAKALISLARCNLLKAEGLIARASAQLQSGKQEDALQDYEDADQQLNQALTRSEESRSQVEKWAPELIADLEFVEGAIYHEQAHIRAVTGYPQESLALFERARQAYAACLKAAVDNSAYPRLKDIAEKSCLPQSKNVEQRLTELHRLADPAAGQPVPSPTITSSP